jgi:cell division septum initiation protein DivIVA
MSDREVMPRSEFLDLLEQRDALLEEMDRLRAENAKLKEALEGRADPGPVSGNPL